MAYFLGVDAGGTKAEFLLGDESRQLARVRVGSIKRMRVSEEVAESNLREAVDELQRQSGIALGDVWRTCIGAAGNTVPIVADWMRIVFPRYVGGSLNMVNDVEIALDAAFHGARGVLVLAGTGSNVAGRNACGQITTAGGWGPALADQGSGHSLGHRALRRGFLALDQQRQTKLLEAACSLWGLRHIDELVAFANESPSPDFSRLAPLVVACAELGDTVAAEVIQQEAGELAELVVLLIERMRIAEADGAFALPEIAYTGSVITHAEPLRDALHRHLSERYPGIALQTGPVDPPAGALWRARQSCSAAMPHS